MYDPRSRYEVNIFDVKYSRHRGEWPATVYQPQGDGPFPAILDVHGGAWNRGSRTDNERFDRALAASGIVVVAIDFPVAPEHPYPAQVAAVNYATRWLKAHASDFNADVEVLGGLGSSSGGHTIMLSAMRPQDPRYLEVSDPEVEGHDATFSYLVTAWPVLDSHARYVYARGANQDRLVESTEAYFLTEAAMREGNPQEILERGDKVELPATLILQGTADANVPMSIPERFVAEFRRSGGLVELEVFPGLPHGFGRTPGPESDRAIQLMKSFIARRLVASPAAV